MDGKSPRQAPQPHLYPTISLYLLEPLLNRLWNVQVAYFRLSSSYVRVSTKKPSNSPWLIGLFRPSMRLNPINHGGGPYGPPAWKSAVFGRKNEIFQKWMDGKSPPQAPQPHLYPTILLYLLEPLLNRLWNVQVAYFRISSSYVCVSTKKPSKSP